MAAEFFLVLCCFLILTISGCAARPKLPPTRQWENPCDTCIDGVKNFAKVSPLLWRGAQPTKEGFRNLETAGVKTILSLREHHDDLALLDGTNLKYLRIPMDAWNPEEAELVLFLTSLERALNDSAARPIFVHCAEGKDRTGYSIAAYRMLFENWTADDAIHEMFDFGFYAIWFQNPTFLRRLNIEKVRKEMRRAP
jgi:protein tyrosine phosphatase (PTP) superfamily phosphohydrolase (DUF442 family)